MIEKQRELFAEQMEIVRITLEKYIHKYSGHRVDIKDIRFSNGLLESIRGFSSGTDIYFQKHKMMVLKKSKICK